MMSCCTVLSGRDHKDCLVVSEGQGRTKRLVKSYQIILVKGDGDSGQIGGRQDSGKWSDSGYLF